MTALGTGLETAVAFAFQSAQLRVVFDLDELRERLEIWDVGLDDGVVECVKLRCLRDQPAMRGPGERIRVARITTEGDLAMRVIDGAAPEHTRAEVHVPHAVVDEVAADATWRARFPDLFTGGFVSIDRYLR